MSDDLSAERELLEAAETELEEARQESQKHIAKKPKKVTAVWRKAMQEHLAEIVLLTKQRKEVQAIIDEHERNASGAGTSSIGRLPALPKFSPRSDMTKREMEDFMTLVEAKYTASGYQPRQRGRDEDCFTAGLLDVFETPVDTTHLLWVTDKLVKPGKTWEEAKLMMVEKFGVIKDQLGPARTMLHSIAQRGSNRTAAEQVELVRRSVNDSLKVPDSLEKWASEHTVYTQLLLESFQDPVRSALVADKRLQAKMDEKGFHGAGELAVTIESELNSASAFAGNKPTCTNCHKPNHTQPECTREGGGKYRPRNRERDRNGFERRARDGRDRDQRAHGRTDRDRDRKGRFETPAGGGSRDRARPSANLTCFACNQQGHKANECPKNSAAIANMSIGAGRGRRRGSSPSSDDDEPLVKKKKAVKQESTTCSLCRGGSHRVDDCPTVAAMRAAERQ